MKCLQNRKLLLKNYNRNMKRIIKKQKSYEKWFLIKNIFLKKRICRENQNLERKK